MGMSRNARRTKAKAKANRALTDALNTAAILKKNAMLRANCAALGKRAMSRPSPSVGLVMDWSGAGKPLGFTRRMVWTKGAAN